MRYKKKKWKKKREHVLRRDEYLCQECKRYGKRVDATTVHHIYPALEYPDYAYCDFNLISLCGKCHDKMHDRVTGQLTVRGRQLKEKTIPPIENKH